MRFNINTRWFLFIGLVALGYVWYSEKSAKLQVFDLNAVASNSPSSTNHKARSNANSRQSNSFVALPVQPNEVGAIRNGVVNPFYNQERETVPRPSWATTQSSKLAADTGISNTLIEQQTRRLPTDIQLQSNSEIQRGNQYVQTPAQQLSSPPLENKAQNFPSIQNQPHLAQPRYPDGPGVMPSSTPNPSILPEINAQLAAQIEYGNTLARKGAMYTAQKQFVGVLYSIAQNRDFQLGNTNATECLARAWKALEEAEDFTSHDARQDLFVDVSEIIESHESQVIASEGAYQMSKMSASQAYYTYVREKMQQAIGHHPIGSQALYSLGKLYSMPQFDNSARSMICHYSAMDCDSNNAASANELGVMLARNGHLVEAKNVLAHCVRITNSPTSLDNYAKVNEKLGDMTFAQSLRNRATEIRAGMPSSDQSMQWVDIDAFNNLPNDDMLFPNGSVVTPNIGPGPLVAEAPIETKQKRSLSDRIKGLVR